MNVTYTFRNDSWRVYPPYHRYYEKEDYEEDSFVHLSNIFVWEYIFNIDNDEEKDNNEEKGKKQYLNWSQIDFYDNNGNLLNEESPIIESVVVFIKNPVYTIEYHSKDVFNMIDFKEDNKKNKEDFIFWASVPLSLIGKIPITLEGVSYKNDKYVMYCKEIFNYNDYKRYKERMTDDCKRRVEFMLQYYN